MGATIPAIYTAPELKPYREWLPGDSYENGTYGMYGSFNPKAVEGYYSTVWELGYGRSVKFDHDFVGRAALEAQAGKPQRRKAWLEWNKKDVERLAAPNAGAKYKALPAPFSGSYDEVQSGGKLVGVTQFSGTTSNIDGYVSVGSVNPDIAEGTDVELVWGDWNGGANNPFSGGVHEQTTIRARVRYTSPMSNK